MKIYWVIVVVIIAAIGGFLLWNPEHPSSLREGEGGEQASGLPEGEEASVVSDGVYTVSPEESTIRWAGQKPLIDGYVNSGTLAVADGIISVSGDTAEGSFTIDMNSLDVGLTAKKPGSEGALEGHLKGERWFNTAEYPTAVFSITKVAPRPESSETLIYDVTGNLTMKGQTHELTFPATIYKDASGTVYAKADFEFDRTLWGITASSASFFDDLADNAVSNMVALSFELVAR